MKKEKMKKAKSHAARQAAKLLLPYLKPHLLPLVAAVVFVVGGCVLNALSPRIEGLITTRLFANVAEMAKGTPGAGVDFAYILRVLLVLGTIYIGNMLCTFVASFALTNAIQNAMRDLRGAVEEKITRLPVRYFDHNSFGNVLSRITNDVDTISNALQQSFVQVVTAVLGLTLALVMMYTINPVMALAATLIIPASFLISRFIVGRSQKYFKHQQDALGKLNGTVQEMYTGFNEIMLYGKQEDALETFEEVNGNLCKSGFKAQFISGLMMPLVSLVTYIGIAAVAVLGALYALSGAITIGNLQAFVRYVWQVNQPLSQVTQLSGAIQSAAAAVSRVCEFLGEPEELPDPESPAQIGNFHGAVTFDHVRFGYTADQPLIRDLNAEIGSGQMVAIVGPTGAGKTTLINLLMRFYDVDGGAIRIDGVDIRDMARDGLRSMFGMVLQDTWLFHGTVRENIAYGRFGASEEEVVAAAKTANVHHFIQTLPDGYDMVLNEEASNVSQGEKQLLTIARAILSDPKILILDEATSSVDTRLELLLQRTMQSIMKGRTSFVIAHRLSTIRSADLILVINHGDIVEQGTHDELMAKGGFYQTLYNSQFAGQASAQVE